MTVEVVDQAGAGLARGPVAALATAVLEAEGAAGTVVVAFVEAPAIAVLNGRYRDVDEPTDVLSFAGAGVQAEWPGGDEPEGRPDLGELAVCPEVVLRYAAEDGCDTGRQLGWTLIHGLLHLLGYDHESDNGEMRKREQELLQALEPLVDALPTPRGGLSGA